MRKSGEREIGIGRRISHDVARDPFADRRAHLEAVTAAAPGNPYVRQLRMAIDDELPVRAVLVLADFRADCRRGAQRRKAAADEIAQMPLSFNRRTSIT